MPFFRSRGLSFRRKRRKVTLTAARSTALFIAEIIITLFIAFVIVYCVGMKVTVVGNSMENTLSDGESVLVNRFTYNLTDPKAGDVIVFRPNGTRSIRKLFNMPEWQRMRLQSVTTSSLCWEITETAVRTADMPISEILIRKTL